MASTDKAAGSIPVFGRLDVCFTADCNYFGQRKPDCKCRGSAWTSREVDRTDLIDEVAEALQDSIDMDWSTGIGAEAVVQHLINLGVVRTKS
jgi:hypothetical protein